MPEMKPCRKGAKEYSGPLKPHMCVYDTLVNSAGVYSHLDRGVSHDALSTLYNGEVGESELVCCLDQTHSVPPHLQENILDLD